MQPSSEALSMACPPGQRPDWPEASVPHRLDRQAAAQSWCGANFHFLYPQVLAGLHEHVPTLPHVDGTNGMSTLADACAQMARLDMLSRRPHAAAYCPAPALAVRHVLATRQPIKLAWPKALFEASRYAARSTTMGYTLPRGQALAVATEKRCAPGNSYQRPGGTSCG